MKEEDNILKRYGKKNPFTVPDNYFENFRKDIMEKLPEKESANEAKITAWQRIKPWIYMTAMFCGLMFSAKMLMQKPNDDIQTIADSVHAEFTDEEIENIIDNSMIDDYSLYTYLSDAEYNHH
jgi:hypothetical protein